MGREALQYGMLILISSIFVVTFVLWEVEKIKHRKAVRLGRRISAGIDELDADEPENDPYEVGINDKDIL
jgi:hypothetical protein